MSLKTLIESTDDLLVESGSFGEYRSMVHSGRVDYDKLIAMLLQDYDESPERLRDVVLPYLGESLRSDVIAHPAFFDFLSLADDDMKAREVYRACRPLKGVRGMNIKLLRAMERQIEFCFTDDLERRHNGIVANLDAALRSACIKHPGVMPDVVGGPLHEDWIYVWMEVEEEFMEDLFDTKPDKSCFGYKRASEAIQLALSEGVFREAVFRNARGVFYDVLEVGNHSLFLETLDRHISKGMIPQES